MLKIFFMVGFFVFMLMETKFLSLIFNLIFLMSFMYLFNYYDGFGVIFGSVSMNYFGLDNYSFFMIILSMWILGLMFMSLDSNNLKMKMLMFLFLMLIFIGFFSSLNLMFLYFFFELSLIPTFFLIIYWGMNPERVVAGLYLMMYTLFISLPLLVYLFWLFFKLSSLNLILMMDNILMLYFFDYVIIFFAFFIKMPMYMFHVWLPKAHVEAPVYGSMVLAAILLKLGTYGLIRMMMIFLIICNNYSFLIFSISIIGSLVVSILCLFQIDMKSLVAYSSVVHMNFLMLAMLSLLKLGFNSSYIMMIGHGLCSSGLFYMVNIYYSKTGSRMMFLNKGMMLILPSYSLWWFLLCVANFSFPLSLNFISELFMIGVIISWELKMMLYLMMICFFSSAYSLYLYSYIQHGSVNFEEKMNYSLFKEFIVMVFHIYPLMIILMNLLMFY